MKTARGRTMKTQKERLHERGLKSAWHAAIAAVGAYEYRHSKGWLAKTLAIGLIAFHIDAAFCDAIGKPTTLQRMLNGMIPLERKIGRASCRERV